MAELKILQVGSSMPNDWGGIERYVSFLGKGLVDRGHDVTLIAPKDSPLAENSKLHVRYAKVRNKYDIGAIGRFIKYYRTFQFDIVNVHFSPDYFVPAWAAKLAGQRGMVMTRHLVLPMKRGRVRAYHRLYDHFIAVSGAAGEAMVASGLPSEKVSVARAGISALRPKKEFDRAADEFAIGIFGRLTSEKGHAELIKAVTQLEGKVRLHVFGNGPLIVKLQDQAKGQPVKFYGQISDVADAMAAMDVVAMPSLWAEAFSIALLEAMSLGKAIVAAPVGGIPEVVSDGETGLLADPRDTAIFAKALQTLADDEVLRNRLGDNAKTLHRSEYTVEKFAERIEGVYLSMLKR